MTGVPGHVKHAIFSTNIYYPDLVQSWECGVLTTWKSLPVTVSAIHQSLDRLLPPNGEEILTSVVFPLPMRSFESSGAAIGLKGSTRWKERVEVHKAAICPDI